MHTAPSDDKINNCYNPVAIFQVLLGIIAVTVAASEYAGLFAPRPQFSVFIIHTKYFFWLSVTAAATTLFRVVMILRKNRSISLLLLQIAILLICSAVWLSRATHFEGKSIRLEGQSMGGLPGDYLRPTLYSTNIKTPNMGFSLLKLTPVAGNNPAKLARVRADILLASISSPVNRELSFSSSFPLFTAGTIVRITDFGYAPRFSMSTLGGQQIDSDYQYLKLFPAGSEDSFVPFTYGYTIALRLWPDYQNIAGKPTTRSFELKNPVFKVRIVRNKDIVYNDYMKLGEKLKFDSSVFQLYDPVMWAEFTMISDAGIYPLATGMVLLAISGIMAIYYKRKDSLSTAA